MDAHSLSLIDIVIYKVLKPQIAQQIVFQRLIDIVIYKVLKLSGSADRSSCLLDRYRNLQGSQTFLPCFNHPFTLDRYRNLQGSQTVLCAF